MYCTDVAKLALFPVIHVNGDDPEVSRRPKRVLLWTVAAAAACDDTRVAPPQAVTKAARVAVAYNRRFQRDVFVDLVCWRRWGHNELDNPRFTNPGMYKIIDHRL